MTEAPIDARYGAPPPDLVADDASGPRIQLSPFAPGSTALETVPDGGLASLVMLAPPGSLERRYVLAHGLRALAPGGRLVALAPKDKGGARLAGELQAFGCAPTESFRRRHRICILDRPAGDLNLQPALDEGAPRIAPELDLWSQPGVFSWDRLDPGSRLLMDVLPPLAGNGADLGCGIGILSRHVLRSEKVESLALVDIDRRAVDCARRNLTDPRASFLWADALAQPLGPLDFVVCNPPFHAEGSESRELGQDFIRAARRALRKGGTLWLVANRHLPYEAVLGAAFRRVEARADKGGYKVVEAVA
ncbi:class I SAM-dependent methyltransferase [Aureimonas altamirensis]|uniref:class I SAM-dependent methyltransferase n=1 Tax=Aureimonas altamirensis TaxID=370622 RepID=UPI001E2A9F38|nr:class I SAM-dependent methyltransferase [Aureimonas altamirensis]UHD46318.1 class I SAM-dependent methyltransferase [Aureimonas altamirensis]